MPHRPQFRLAFKPAAKLAFVAPPKLHLYRVEIVTGFAAGLVYDTSRPMTRQAAYEAATSLYGNERPLITLTTIDPTAAAWVPSTRITAEAAEAARKAALPIPPKPAKRNLFTPTDPEPVVCEVINWAGVNADYAEIEDMAQAELAELMGAGEAFDWTESGWGFGSYRSGFGIDSTNVSMRRTVRALGVSVGRA